MAIAVVLFVLLGGTFGYYEWSTAGAKTPVVVAAADIPLGHVIARSDLTTTDLAGALTAVGGNHLDSLVGQTATVSILAGSPLQRAMVAPGYPVAAGQTVVGVAVAGSQIPSIGVQPGNKLVVLQLPAKDATASPGSPVPNPTVLADSVVLLDIRSDPTVQGGFLLSLVVPSTAAPGIAAASNTGLVAVVRPGGKG
jgi:hypothetical protein